jgi:hypothetical protein
MLSEQLGIPPAEAEKVLDRLPANPQMRVETVVDEKAVDGQLRYRLADGAAPQDVADMTAEQAEHADFDARLAAAMRAKGPEKK